mmetsp:Transcript_31/g.67  ORF Transcript_31/g.67 Transcript_31/m.67 type:complete len:246 (+) Transcript_31:151-888(+)|eukprot:CAMPEP_0178651726 /NCGR_PEP_ID=MMETSP0698-20121128/22257_1 /TAXON_ID=265572 /ORGANISM="Extubocellulus spinifer, Strain CCMP396" /LENGTH=245 /DNA_ID=CAMNT_0020293359 /DNA_START=75 /DNA_END=815 /DNA_ORIENTATION=+
MYQLTKLLTLALTVLLLIPTPGCDAYGGGSKKKRHRRRRHKRSSRSKTNAFNHGKINNKYADYTALELLEALTDKAGPNKGFSILAALIEGAELEGEVDGGLEDFTLFAPNDQAFCRTAKNDLEYEGSCDPPDAEDVLAHYVAVLDLVADGGDIVAPLTAILSYHAALGEMTVKKLRKYGIFTTLCECFEIAVKKVKKGRHKKNKITKLIDDGPKYPNIDFRQQNVKVIGGIVHVIKGVLIPPLD